jgi:hypothetical protein
MQSFWAALDRLFWRIRRLFFRPTVMQIAPGYEGYGGATITRRVDGAGAEWIACCARGPDGYFGFYAFKNGVNVPLSPRVSGRGSIHDDGYWIAWEGSTKHQGVLPGFVPVSKGAPVAIPAGGALAVLYTGVYVAADFDTPDETALRVQRQLDAIQELTLLLQKAGVLV